MGNGKLLIGQGYGDATVWNPNQQVQNFANIVAQQKADQASKDKALIDQLATIKPEGIREYDKEDFKAKYNEYKNSFIGANNLPKNSRERLEALAEVQRKYGELGDFIGKSKEEKAREMAISNSLVQQPHLFSDDAHQRLLASMKSPMSASGFIKGNDYNALERYVDPIKMDKLYSDFKTGLVKNTQFDNGVQTPGRQGDKKGVFITQSRGIPMDGENGALNNLLNFATVNKDFKKYIGDRYKDIQSEDPQQTLAMQLKQYAADRGDEKGFYDVAKPVFKPAYKPEKDKEPSWLQSFYMRQYGTPTKPPAASDDHRDAFISAIQQGERTARTQLINAANSAGAKFNPTDDAVEIIFQKPVKQTEKDKDGKEKITTVMQDEVFTIPKDGAQTDVIQVNNLLDKLNLFKKRPLYTAKVNQYDTPKPTVKAPATAPKTIKQSDIATKASAAGYTVKEYTDLLKQRGIKIQ